MKKDVKKLKIEESHCPFCKRHCPLSNPHCSKGKTLAKKLKDLEKKKKHKEMDKKDENKVKNTKKILLRALAEKGSLSKKALEEETKIPVEKLDSHLQKLEKRSYISISQDEDPVVVITKEGTEFLAEQKEKKAQKESKKDLVFTSLTEAEKENLKQIMEKLISEWNGKAEQ